MASKRFIYAQLTDDGLMDYINQDAALSLILSGAATSLGEDVGLFIVADGEGGGTEGQQAAAFGVGTITSEILNRLCGTQIQPGQELMDLLVKAYQMANQKVYETWKDDYEFWGGGMASATAVLVTGNTAHIVHTGSTRAYFITENTIEQLTSIHTFPYAVARRGQITLDEAFKHPLHNMVYRRLGTNKAIDVETKVQSLVPGSCLLLCTNGLPERERWTETAMDTAPSIHEIVNRYPIPLQACEQLVQFAKTDASAGNITVLLIKMAD